MDEDQHHYLVGLVRQDVQRHQKAIDRFAPREGQDPEEAAALRAKFIDDQEFRQDVLAALKEGKPVAQRYRWVTINVRARHPFHIVPSGDRSGQAEAFCGNSPGPAFLWAWRGTDLGVFPPDWAPKCQECIRIACDRGLMEAPRLTAHRRDQ